MIRGLALCAGVGGLELGVSLAAPRVRTICFVEREAYAAAILVARMRDGALDPAPIWSDVATFDAVPWRGVVDIVTAGYPCQPFSAAGNRAGVNDRRHLWPHIERIVRDAEPLHVFAENVADHLSNGFDVIARSLGAMGFRVAATLHTAAEHGAPHRRERLFWLATRDDPSALLADADEQQCARGLGAESVSAQHDPPASGGDDPDADGGRREAVGVEVVTGVERESGHVVDRHDPGEWWGVEPGLGRVADGVAYRLDRLRCTGNGVVPVVAAHAFVELARELAP